MKTDKIVWAVKARETKIIKDRRRFHIDAEVALGNNTVSADGAARTLYLSATQCKPG